MSDIVDQLPMTKDGVRVIPCVTPVYHPLEIGADGPAALYVNSNNLRWASRGFFTGTPYMPLAECYSTKEAAEKAREAQSDRKDGDEMRRNLSGIYFRYEGENVCFEELPVSEQARRMEGKSSEWLKSLAKHLARALINLGDDFDIVAGGEPLSGAAIERGVSE